MPIVLDGTAGITTPQVTTDDGEAYAPGNIVGTVSQSGGVPTGAIIERGSNANGEFVKFADGTMICTISRVDGPLASSVPSYLRSWTYPSAFFLPPVVTGTYNSTNSDFSGAVVLGRLGSANSTVEIGIENTRLNASFASGALIAVRYVANGRWF